MFKIESVRFNHGLEYQEYSFKINTFIYGQNTVGKTALTKAIDFVLGSSENLGYQGLDNIDSVEAHLSNNNTHLWVKRSIVEEYYYRRTIDSEYSIISMDTYKKNICLILNESPNPRFLEIYEKVFDERATFRSFIFLNFIEEKGLGDLSVVFTKAKELKHQIRIRDIMNFFFNYENVEQIYEKRMELEGYEQELSELNINYIEFESSIKKIKKLFTELQLKYSGDIKRDLETFKSFKETFVRKKRTSSPDLVYLAKASFSLAEEIKLYTFMQNQSKNMVERKEHTSRLLAVLNAITEKNPNYKAYSTSITQMIKQIEDDKVILSLTDYQASIQKILEEKEKIDLRIKEINGESSELEYDEAVKKIGLLEHCFSVIDTHISVNRIEYLNKKINILKGELKALNRDFDKKNIESFNATLTSQYLSKGINVKHINEDLVENEFKVEFDPFRLFLLTAHKVEGKEEYYLPGSMARQTHLQLLTYLCMFDYLKQRFSGFIYLPLLIIDSANQPMGIEVFKQVYPLIIKFANEIGIQTIFLSKDKINGVESIDISGGLNRFHKQ